MEIALAKLIFGINFEFKVKDKYHFDILHAELKGYPDVQDVDVVVREVDNFEGEVLSRNPSIHHEFSDGFLVKNRIMDRRFVFKDKNLIRIDFRINESPGLMTYLRKWNNIQFTNRRMRIGQMLHEDLLVPATFFRENLMPIHCSGINTNSNQVLLFGGTGGVGKTSIEIKLASLSGNQFVSDDIAIVDDEKSVHKNLNYPKIYAYNTVGNDALLNRLLNSNVISDKVHWHLSKHLKGIDKVRRRIAPDEIYEVINDENHKVSTVYYLFKKDVPEMRLQELDSERATELSLEIIANEYASFISHIRWHNYNRMMIQKEVIINEEGLMNKWRSIGNKFYKDLKIYALYIPLEIEHKYFLEKVEELITSK